MTEFNNTISYGTFLLRIFGGMLLASIILYFVKGGGILIYLFLLLLVAIIFLSRKFTQKIIITEDEFQITYYRWLFPFTLKLKTQQVQLKLEDYLEARGNKHKVLLIIQNKQVVYSINSSQGFDVYDLEVIVNTYRSL